uniref:Uncharacterized protein n=1 Tax=Myripristis murdjan TaxID=586833 RepID=A0A667YX42_9TELE
MRPVNSTQSQLTAPFVFQADALRQSGLLCDAIISVGSQTFKAHRLVLACASRTLAQQLTLGDTDSPIHCTLEHFSPHTFQQVLDFTYTQALEVPVGDLHLLLRAAQLLEMQSLEDQCRKKLDTLDLEEANYSLVMKNCLASDLAEGNTSPPPPRKKPRMPSVSATTYKRDSVISRPATSHSSFSSPWAIPKSMWHPMNALKQMAQSLIAAHPLQPSPQSVAYPFSLSTPHMFPLLATSFPSQVHSSVMGYSGIYHPYMQSLYAGSPGMEDMVKQGVFCGRRDEVQHPQQSHRQEHGAEKPYQCRYCPKRFSLKHQLDTHHRVHTGEKPFECRLCGQRSRDYSAMIKHLRTHGGATPYQCTVCLEFCSSLVTMQRHVKNHAVQDFPPDWTKIWLYGGATGKVTSSPKLKGFLYVVCC